MQDFITNLKKVISAFETKKDNEKAEERSLGVIYTPKPLADYMVLNIFKLYFNDLFNFPDISNSHSYFKSIKNIISKNKQLEKELIKKLSTLKILDPACGTGRFLTSSAEILYQFYSILNSNLTDYAIRRNIIYDNLYGIEIDKSAFIITKLKLVSWLFSGNKESQNYTYVPKVNSNNLEEIDQIVETFQIRPNISNLDFLLEFKSKNFDIIIGNPPYVENKKITNTDYKKKLTKRFESAYRLFDLSILFFEKSIEILKENEAYLSMITTNKFLAADYGIRIRKLLMNKTELKEIINVSSLPVFHKTAAYPIIISFKKSKPKENNTVIVKKFEDLNDLYENGSNNSQLLPQKLIKNVPSFVFPIAGEFNLINYLYTNYKPFSEKISDLKIYYRPYGFINWSNHLNKLSIKNSSKHTLLLIGTGNVGKFCINFDKPIKIAKKTTNIAYFEHHKEFGDVWKEFSGQKLIFREIAKELTCVYDPGLYTNLTGLYFIRIPSFNQEQLFCLLTIMNSQLMKLVFTTLFSSLHLAGGYLRFNGSFIKRLPMPTGFPLSLSLFGRFLQILYQLQYDLNSLYPFDKSWLPFSKEDFQREIAALILFYDVVCNALVNLLYLDECYIESNQDFILLRELLYSKSITDSIQFKYLIPRYKVKNFRTYSKEELILTLDKIRDFKKKIVENKKLLYQIDHSLNREKL
ncbi:MAG: Eco57I restriction-modification methylase domain-containing protein [Candidatus Thorarchaeota archaeon]